MLLHYRIVRATAYGTTGLLHAPTAEMRRDKTVWKDRINVVALLYDEDMDFIRLHTAYHSDVFKRIRIKQP